MALDFPNTPVDGETYTDIISGLTYRYDGAYKYWKAITEPNAVIYADSVGARRYVTFLENSSGTFSKANVDFDLTYNPDTNWLDVNGTVNARAVLINQIPVSNISNSYADSTFVKLSSPTQTITGNLSITGALFVSGNTFIIDANTLSVQDPLIYLAGNNYSSDIVDIGFIANYVNSTGQNVHTGLYREHEDKQYYLFYGYDKEPINNHIGALSNNMVLAVLNADLKTSNLLLGGVNAISWITAAFAKANDSSGYYQGNRGDFGSQNYQDIFRSHANTLTANVTIYSGNNSIAAGPLTIALNRTLTIQTGSRVAIV